jgi:hypothetical protein
MSCCLFVVCCCCCCCCCCFKRHVGVGVGVVIVDDILLLLGLPNLLLSSAVDGIFEAGTYFTFVKESN